MENHPKICWSEFNIANAAWGQFAGMCIKVDLTKLVIGKVLILQNCYRKSIEFECFHIICYICYCHGHATWKNKLSLGWNYSSDVEWKFNPKNMEEYKLLST